MKLRSKILFTIVVLLNSCWIYSVYLRDADIGVFKPALLVKALEGTADRPYAFRVLTPLLAKIFSPLITPRVLDLFSSLPDPFKSTLNSLGKGSCMPEAAVIMILMFLALIGFAFAERKLLESLSLPPRDQFVLPLFAQALILPFSFLFAYYYDLPQIFLVTVSLIFMNQCKWTPYLLSLALATLNKETSLFLIIIFVIYYLPRLPRNKFFELLSAQLAIYTIIRVSLSILYRNNPGSTLLLTLPEHYKQYSSHPSTLIFTLLLFFSAGFLALRGWRHKHPFIRASVVMPLLILVMFITSGMPMEFRVFLDALPILVILLYRPDKPAVEKKVEELRIVVQ